VINTLTEDDIGGVDTEEEKYRTGTRTTGSTMTTSTDVDATKETQVKIVYYMFKKQDRTGNQVQSDNNNTKPKGKLVRFDGDANDSKPVMHGTILGIETITKNKAKFSKRDVRRAEKAQILQHIANGEVRKFLPSEKGIY